MNLTELRWWENKKKKKQPEATRNPSQHQNTVEDQKPVIREQLLHKVTRPSVINCSRSGRFCFFSVFFCSVCFFNDSITQFRQLRSSPSDFPINQSRHRIAHRGEEGLRCFATSTDPSGRWGRSRRVGAQAFRFCADSVQQVLFFPGVKIVKVLMWRKRKVWRKLNRLLLNVLKIKICVQKIPNNLLLAVFTPVWKLSTVNSPIQSMSLSRSNGFKRTK